MAKKKRGIKKKVKKAKERKRSARRKKAEKKSSNKAKTKKLKLQELPILPTLNKSGKEKSKKKRLKRKHLPPMPELPISIKKKIEKKEKKKTKKETKREKKEEKSKKFEEFQSQFFPKMTVGKGIVSVSTKKKIGELIEKYDVEADGARASVEVRKEAKVVTYNVDIPEINPATSTLLDEIRNELISVTTISMKELTDPSLFSSIKDKFMQDAKKMFHQRLPKLDKDIEIYLVGTLMQEMLGLGRIEFLVADPNLEEIVIPSAKEPIRVYSKKYGWLLTNLRIKKEEEIINYSNIIARRVGRQITVLNPLLDAHLVTGDRVNAVLYPVNTKGNTITIRKFARDPFTMIDFINNKTCDLDTAALLWLAIEYEMNVLISGGTGSGKTSFLNACMPFIPPNQRIISIEDTRELMLPDFLYWAPLVTRTPNPEGKGEVSMLDLLINSLRMRPDRIILGEMRKQQEAMVLFEAMHTGHSVYATVHADSAAETISRLVHPPLNVPHNLLKAVNLNVVMFRDRRRGIRRVMQIAEFEAEAESARSNILYRWVSDMDKIVTHSESSRFYEDVSRNTGMSQEEITKDLGEKKAILSYLAKNNIRSLNDFGNVMNLFYRDKMALLDAVRKNNKSAILGR
jgi:archaeal flagellar protein FlaI